jgi:methane monooxygenase PmoA-like
MKTRLFLLLLVPAAAVALAALGPLPAAEPEDVVINTTTDFVADGALVGRYHTAAVAKPYLWPLNGPGGVPLTRAWPMEKGLPGGSTDHVHQKSAWFCHGDVIPEGLELTAAEKNRSAAGVDFWSEEKGHGVIVCTQLGQPRTDKDHGELTTQNEWRTATGRKVLDETRTIHFYDLGDTRLFVFDIDLYADEVPITFGDTKEGAFGIRINDAIREEIGTGKEKTKGPGQIENAEGKVGEKECWGYPSAWCDYSGSLDGKTVGLAILTDPANPYPSCWHSRGYGLMAANPFGREKSGFPAMKGRTDLVKVAKGEHLKLRFGILLHPGDAKEGKVAESYDRFVKLKG